MQLLTVCVLSFLFPFLPFPTNHIAMWLVSKKQFRWLPGDSYAVAKVFRDCVCGGFKWLLECYKWLPGSCYGLQAVF